MVAPLQSQCSEDGSRNPGQSAALAVEASSGFNGETLPQRIKQGATKGDFLPSISGLYVHVLTKANTRVYLPANPRHTNVLYVLSIFIQFPFKSLHYKSIAQQQEKVASSKRYHTLSFTLLLAPSPLPV